jgi:hypothetical protein
MATVLGAPGAAIGVKPPLILSASRNPRSGGPPGSLKVNLGHLDAATGEAVTHGGVRVGQRDQLLCVVHLG